MTFDYPLLLILAPVVGLAAAAAAWLVRRQRIRMARRWSPALAKSARSRGAWAPVIFGLAATLAMIGVAGPRAGQARITTKNRALSVVFAVDISRSMLAEDAAPSRLQRAVRDVRRLVQDLQGDRLGLIAFAGRSYILAPLTVDGGAIRMYLDALDPDIASEGGTHLGAMLAQGRELLSAASDAADRVLVVFTDGEAHDTLPEVVAQAKALQAAGIRLVLVAEGGTTPTRIPIRDSAGTLIEYKHDADGATVETARRDDVLRAVADAGEGELVPNESADQAGAVRELLATMKRNPTIETRTADLVPRAWIPVLGALLLLIGYTWLRPGPSLIGLAGLCWLALPRPARAQDRSPAPVNPAPTRAGAADSAAKVPEFTGPAADTAAYNAGTAALQVRRFDVAREALKRAAQSIDPDLRYRALYNLGLVELLAANADSSAREQHLDEAVNRLREALRIQPASSRAKWNLELANRRRTPPPPQHGGGGGGGGGGGAQQPPQPAPPPPAGGLSREQAEQILGSMERREQATRAEQQRRLPASASTEEKDW